MAAHKITLTQTNWTGGTAAIYFDDISQLFYDDANLTNEVQGITPPTRECWQLNGFFAVNSTTNPGTQYITPEGGFTDEFIQKCVESLTGTATLTIYVNGTQKSWKLTLSVNGGTADTGTPALYYALDGSGWYTNYLCEGTAAHAIEKPKYAAKVYKGHFNGTSTPGTQYIDKDGSFLPALDALTLTAAKTIYAAWVSPYKITVSANSGAGGYAAFYYDHINGIWYETTDFDHVITSVQMHTRECYASLGYRATNADAGVLRVSANGTIDPAWIPTAATTIYARWQLVSYKVTINKNNGAGGTNAIYYKAATSPKQWYADDLCTQQVTNLPELPTRDGYAIKGIFSSTSSSTKYIDRDGEFTSTLEDLAITANKTFYAQWGALVKITINAGGGTGSPAEIWYSAQDVAYFADKRLDQRITSITPPGKECWSFTGCWSASSGGTKYIDENGGFLPAFESLAPTSAKTIYAQWVRVSYKITLDPNGGSGGDAKLYSNGTTAGQLYADDSCTHPVTAAEMPVRAGYTPLGYYATPTGGSKYIDGDGRIIVAVALAADITIHARWQANVYTVTFDYQGGSGSVQSKQVTFGQKVGTLPTATKPRNRFVGWYVNNEKITADTVWNVPNDTTAMVVWRVEISPYCGQVTDWFNMENDSLVALSSNSGDNRQRVYVSHIGKNEPGVGGTGGIWRNPTVTYQVVRDCKINITLGKAFGSSAGVSGYMVTGAKLETKIGQFPMLTVTATANEGADAINLFHLAVTVKARVHAQNLLNAISGGGQLQSCSLNASCTPVVIAEDQMPCASDVVNGKIIVQGVTYAPNGENAPTAGGGFIETGAPKQCGDKDYLMWQLKAEKDM